MEPTEASLVVDARNGSLDAFGELVVLYQNDMYGYVLRIVGDATAAYDVTQDVFLRAHRALGSLETVGRFRPWLYSIAVNTSRNWLKQRRRQSSRFVNVEAADAAADEWMTADPNPLASPLAAEQLRELGKQLHNVISSLPDEYREVAVLRFQHELKVSEIAAALDLTVAATESRLRRAREKLRTQLVANGMARG